MHCGHTIEPNIQMVIHFLDKLKSAHVIWNQDRKELRPKEKIHSKLHKRTNFFCAIFQWYFCQITIGILHKKNLFVCATCCDIIPMINVSIDKIELDVVMRISTHGCDNKL